MARLERPSAWFRAAWVWFFVGCLWASTPARADEAYGRHQFSPAEREHWSFQPVRRPEIPAVADATWVKNPIDAFVLAKLEFAKLAPARPADRETLLRRAFLDLIGLPPTPEERQEFLADESPDAFACLIDRLLARPEYGERWARHWLDVVRFAESNGYERDGAKPQAWRYRDYVIEAFNRDKPFDRFLTEQIAGDELLDSGAEQQIATTFLRLGLWDDEPADPVVDRYDQLDDIVGTTSSTFMAITLRCARCHNHKFESFTQRDYSRLLAIFEPLKRPQDDRADLDRPVGTSREVAEYLEGTQEIVDKSANCRATIERSMWTAAQRLAKNGHLPTPTDGSVSEERAIPSDVSEAFCTEPMARTDAQRELVKKYHDRVRARIEQLGTNAERVELKALERLIEDLAAARPAELPRAYIWFEDSTQAPVTHVFKRGNPRDPIETVEAGFPAILVDAAPTPAAPTAFSTGRRRQFAAWLTQPEHPLTARVMVNRIWQHHLGDGLVGTENDFGVMGEAPSHPELLDWLASEFVAGGWSIKQMHRLIMLSNTYQMSSEPNEEARRVDSSNDLLWRFNSRRLEAEVVRDGVLACSGRLNRQRGGPSVFPRISEAVLASQSRPGNGWTTSDEPSACRRTVYVFVKRTLLVPELEVLDFPDTNGTCEQRLVSTVSTQALTWLNGEFMQTQSRAFAERLLAEVPTSDGDFEVKRVERAFLLTVGRMPSDAERAATLEFLVRQRAQIELDRLESDRAASASGETSRQPVAPSDAQAWQALCLVLLNTNEFVYLP